MRVCVVRVRLCAAVQTTAERGQRAKAEAFVCARVCACVVVVGSVWAQHSAFVCASVCVHQKESEQECVRERCVRQ